MERKLVKFSISCSISKKRKWFNLFEELSTFCHPSKDFRKLVLFTNLLPVSTQQIWHSHLPIAPKERTTVASIKYLESKNRIRLLPFRGHHLFAVQFLSPLQEEVSRSKTLTKSAETLTKICRPKTEAVVGIEEVERPNSAEEAREASWGGGGGGKRGRGQGSRLC